MPGIIAVDLGNSNTRIFVNRKNKIVFNEPTLVALSNHTDRVFSVGYEAAKLLGKCPEGVRVVSPLVESNLYDLDDCQRFISAVLKERKIRFGAAGATLIITVHSSLSPILRNALKTMGKKLKARKVIIVNKTEMAALGADIDPHSSKGSMVLDLGGGTSDVAVISMGAYLLGRSIAVSGSTIDKDIVRYLRDTHHLKISEKTAEYIKIKIGGAGELFENHFLQVSGVSVETSLPHSVIINSQQINEVIRPSIERISELVRDMLFSTPPELARDIVENGITLTGGGALLSGIREVFEKEFRIPVRIASEPLEATIEGCIAGINVLSSLK